MAKRPRGQEARVQESKGPRVQEAKRPRGQEAQRPRAKRPRGQEANKDKKERRTAPPRVQLEKNDNDFNSFCSSNHVS